MSGRAAENRAPRPGTSRQSGHVAVQPPSIPLVLRGMRRSRHRPLPSGRLSVALLSVIALVAFSCIPALAQAGECTDSSCKQYETDIPTVGNEEKPKHHTQGEPKAEASESPPAKQGNQSQPSEGNSEESEKSQGAAPPSNNNGGGGNGNADKGNSPGGNNGSNQAPTGIEDEKSLGGTTQGQNASHSDGGGSSPLVPILIAIAVLAAISIGVVIYRQRRQGSGGTGSPVSPNA